MALMGPGSFRAGQVRLTAGLEARSVSGYPSVNFDLGAAAQIFSAVLGAGFYYKTFKWPGWKLFEPSIRRMAGIGRARIEADHRRIEHRHACCDVLVIGAGPAGLITARALRGTGLSVVIREGDRERSIDGAIADGARLQVRCWR